jgi:acylphosphatase
MSNERVRLRIRGRVQGVFFRETLRRAAVERGLGGSASNLPDGSVEAVFEGPAADVAALVELAHAGPPAADVDVVEITHEDPRGESGFTTD